MLKIIQRIFIFLSVFVISQISVMASEVEFALVSDVHLVPDSFNEENSNSKNLFFTVNSINSNKNIKFVVFLGDCIDKSNEKSLYEFMDIVSKLNKPYYIVYGNHDAYSAGGIDKEKFAEIIREYNKKQPLDTSFYFSVNKDVKAIVLDGSSYLVPGKHGKYLPDVIDGLAKFLKHYSSKVVFIFQHFPIIPPDDNPSHETFDADVYQDLISKYSNIALIASGHYHVEKITIDDNGIYHISVPALGKRNGSRSSSSYFDVKVDYDKILFSKPKNVRVNVTKIRI